MNKGQGNKPNRKCAWAEFMNPEKQSTYERWIPEKKPQLLKSESVGLSDMGLENGHLCITMHAMQQTLY